MSYIVCQLTLVRKLLRALIESQGYKVVEDSKKRFICSQVNFDAKGYRVTSVKVSGIKKLKVEDSTHYVQWEHDRLVCDCKRAEFSTACRHRRAVTKAVLSVDDIDQHLLKSVEALSDDDKRTMKLHAMKLCGFSKEDIIEKGGIRKALNKFQKMELYRYIEFNCGW